MEIKGAAATIRMGMEKHKPLIAMILIQLIFAGMALFSKAAVTLGMKPSIFVAYRQAIATLAIAPFAIFFERSGFPPLTWFLLVKIFLLASFGLTLTLNLYYTGMKYVSATIATTMSNTTPVLVFVLAVCFRLERLAICTRYGKAKVLGSILGLAGTLTFTLYKGPSLISGIENVAHNSLAETYTREGWIKGILIILASLSSWSMWLTMQGPVLKEYPAKLRFTALQCFFSCILTTIYAAIVERDISSWKLDWNINLLSVVYCGVVVTAVTYTVQAWVIQRKGPVYAASFGPLSIIITAIFSTIVFQETLHLSTLLGGLILISGLYCFLWGKNVEAKIEEQNEPDLFRKEVDLESTIVSKSTVLVIDEQSNDTQRT